VPSVDLCLWLQVLEYFDAHLVGLTATPSKQMFGFFNQNLVMEYNDEQAVAEQGGHHVIHDDGSLPKLPRGRGEFTMSPSTSPPRLLPWYTFSGRQAIAPILYMH